MNNDIILKVEDLRKWFPLRKKLIESLLPTRGKQQYVKAADGVTFEVRRGEIFGIVGESGCGKTTIGRLILRLDDQTSGNVFFEGSNIFSLKKKTEILKFRRQMQIVFQDPYDCLSPRLSVYELLSEPLEVHGEDKSKTEVEKRVMEMLDITGLPTTEEFVRKRPRGLSGGQRQRVAIARSLMLSPKFVVADEPVSMLDASLKGSIVKLILSLREKLGLTYLLITHDLSIAWTLCDRIAIMYLGKIVESAPTDVAIKNPTHPYSQALIAAVPTLDLSPESYLRIDEKIRGEIPTPINLPSGCRFHPRCPLAKEICRKNEPEIVEIKKGHFVACHQAI